MRDFAHHPRLRVTALSVCAAGSIIRGIAYVDAPLTRYTTFVDALVPLHVWGIVWVTAGALMLVGIWHRVVARWALSIGASLWAVWALSYLVSWMVGDQPRAWVTAGALAVVAGLMWIVASLADSTGPLPRVRASNGEEPVE